MNGELHHLPPNFNDLEDYVESCIKSVRQAHKLDWQTKAPDAQALRPYMLWQPPEVIKHTLDNTTQWGRHVPHGTYKKAYKSLSQQQMSVAAMKQLQQILFTLILLQLMMDLPVLNFMLVWFLFTIV